jgi:hypothetical protein
VAVPAIFVTSPVPSPVTPVTPTTAAEAAKARRPQDSSEPRPKRTRKIPEVDETLIPEDLTERMTYYGKQSVVMLKQICKVKKIPNYSKHNKKDDLLAFLRDNMFNPQPSAV